MLRNPVVSNSFYPGDPATLGNYLSQAAKPAGERVRALGVVAPHAGYVYSGGAAGRVFGTVEVPDTVLLLGPNHTGQGTQASIMSRGAWRTPLGDALIDEELADRLKAACPVLKEDSSAHQNEHSLEVQLPFIQHANPAATIVPIAFMLRSLEAVAKLGKEIGQTLLDYGKPVLMVASSDMNHYESAQVGKRKDSLALDRVVHLDPQGLWQVVTTERITMCGVIPTAVMLYAAIAMGATRAELVVYTNSGDVTGDYSSVVGYAGVVVG